MGFSRKEYWGGLPFPPLGELPHAGIEPVSPALAERFFTTSTTWEAQWKWKSFSHVQLFCIPHSPWNYPGQNTGVGSLSLLQGIFPTLGSNPGLPHCRQIVYQLSQGRTGGQYNISRIKNWIYNLIKHLKNVFSFKAENKTLSTLCVPPPLLYLEKHLGMNCSSPSNQIMHTNNIIYSWVRRKGRTFYLLSISQYVKKQNKTQLFNIFSFSTKML